MAPKQTPPEPAVNAGGQEGHHARPLRHQHGWVRRSDPWSARLAGALLARAGAQCSCRRLLATGRSASASRRFVPFCPVKSIDLRVAWITLLSACSDVSQSSSARNASHSVAPSRWECSCSSSDASTTSNTGERTAARRTLPLLFTKIHGDLKPANIKVRPTERSRGSISALPRCSPLKVHRRFRFARPSCGTQARKCCSERRLTCHRSRSRGSQRTVGPMCGRSGACCSKCSLAAQRSRATATERFWVAC